MKLTKKIVEEMGFKKVENTREEEELYTYYITEEETYYQTRIVIGYSTKRRVWRVMDSCLRSSNPKFQKEHFIYCDGKDWIKNRGVIDSLEYLISHITEVSVRYGEEIKINALKNVLEIKDCNHF